MLLQMHFWNASSANPTDVLSHCVAESEIPPPRLHQASYLGDSQLQQIKEHSLLINMDRKLLKSNLL